MITKLLQALGIKRDVGAPVHSGVNPVYFCQVYPQGEFWIFSWRTPDHSQGSITEHYSKGDAELSREAWNNRKSITEHATCIIEG